MGNKKSIDINIKAKNASSISVDVKSVQGYSSIAVNNVKPAVNHFIAAVVNKNKSIIYWQDEALNPDNSNEWNFNLSHILIAIAAFIWSKIFMETIV